MTQPTPFTVLSSTQVREVNTTRWPKTPQQFHEEYQEAESKLQTFEIHPESRKIKAGDSVFLGNSSDRCIVLYAGKQVARIAPPAAESYDIMCNRLIKWAVGSQVLGIKEQYEGKTVVKIIE